MCYKAFLTTNFVLLICSYCMDSSKEALLTAAIDLFANKGYEATSVSMVAKQAGLSKASVFHHFKNKEQLYVSSIEHTFTAVSTVWGELESQFSDSFGTNLQIITDAMLDFELNNAHAVKMVLRELLDTEQGEYARLARDLLKEYLSGMMGLVKSAHSRSNSRKKLDYAEITLKMISHCVFFIFMGRSNSQFTEFPMAASDNLFVEWLVRDLLK